MKARAGMAPVTAACPVVAEGKASCELSWDLTATIIRPSLLSVSVTTPTCLLGMTPIKFLFFLHLANQNDPRTTTSSIASTKNATDGQNLAPCLSVDQPSQGRDE